MNKVDEFFEYRLTTGYDWNFRLHIFYILPKHICRVYLLDKDGTMATAEKL